MLSECAPQQVPLDLARRARTCQRSGNHPSTTSAPPTAIALLVCRHCLHKPSRASEFWPLLSAGQAGAGRDNVVSAVLWCISRRGRSQDRSPSSGNNAHTHTHARTHTRTSTHAHTHTLAPIFFSCHAPCGGLLSAAECWSSPVPGARLELVVRGTVQRRGCSALFLVSGRRRLAADAAAEPHVVRFLDRHNPCRSWTGRPLRVCGGAP